MHTHNNASKANCYDPLDHQYGRRVEADRSWTVYHVFTGVPADVGDGAMMGLNRMDATERMLSLNRHGAPDYEKSTWLKPPARHAGIGSGRT